MGGHMASLSKEVVERVTQIGNVMLVEAPVLLLCLPQTLHQFYKREERNATLCRGPEAPTVSTPISHHFINQHH